jgi:hypothetical protein
MASSFFEFSWMPKNRGTVDKAPAIRLGVSNSTVINECFVLLTCGLLRCGKMVIREAEMKVSRIISILLFGASIGIPQSRSFTGEIMDSQCASMGSHDQMMKGMDAKDAKDCTKKCVRTGGKYVLYDPVAKTTYALDDQQKGDEYAGQKVSVKGTFDSTSSTIHVTGVQAR